MGRAHAPYAWNAWNGPLGVPARPQIQFTSELMPETKSGLQYGACPKNQTSRFFFFSRPAGLLQRSDNVM